MPAPLEIIVTNAGRAAIVNAQNTGTAPVTIAQIGLSAAAVTPLPTAAALPGELKRVAAIAGEVVADDTIHVTLTDESADAYSLRSLALYLADGTMFAIYGQATPVLEKTAQSIAALSIDVIFADIAAAAITFGNATFTNPPATTERQGVVELTTIAEAQAGLDALRALTSAGGKASVLGWLLAQDGSGSGLDADLLDGQDGSYYTNITARLGYTPANRAGDTFTGGVNAPYVWVSAGGDGTNIRVGDDAFIGDSNIANGISIRGQSNWNAGFVRFGNSPYTLGCNGSDDTLRYGGSILWHSGIDGAGSGLDADLLDGQDGSYYTNIVARLGFTPVNKAGDTMTGALALPGNPATALQAAPKQYVDGLVTAAALLAKLVTVDGSGSGLDADLLDGQDSSYFTNIIARLGFTPVNKAGDTLTGGLSMPYLTVSASGDGANIRVGDDAFIGDSNITNGISIRGVGNWNAGFVRFGNSPYTLGCNGSDEQLRYGGSVVWNSGIDGSGSGLDADLLDGFHASDLLRVISESKASSGYMQLSNGLLLQWGRWTSSASPGAALTVTFPVAFSAEPYTLVTMPVITSASAAATWSSDGITGSSFPARCSIASIGCRYFAIGPV